jgi:two-component system, cell cycle sensor histidine kinase and response regulator CckA
VGLLLPRGPLSWAAAALGTAACVILFILFLAVPRQGAPLASPSPAARESSTILRNLLQYSPDYIFIKDLQLRMVLCNPLFAESLGKRPEELYGKTDVENGVRPEFITGNPEMGLRGYEQDDLDTLAGKIVRTEGEPIEFTGGEPRYLDTVKVPLRDDTGTVIGLLGIGRDVTAGIRLQRSLEKERTLLATLVSGLPELIYAKDREGRFILANRADANFMGAGDPADLIGKSDYDYYRREVADAFFRDDMRVIEQGVSIVNKEEPNTSAIGEYRWILTTKVPLRDEKGTVIGLVGTGHDITGRKVAEQREKEQAALLDIVPDAIFVRDMGHRIRYWNKGAEKIYGWTQAEVLGRNAIEVLFAPPHTNEPADAFRKTRDEGEWSGDFHTVSKDGKAMTVEARWILVKDATGSPTGILVVNTDVTERRSTQLQLLRVQRLESLGILAGGIAHDLNNVLTPVLMGVDGLSGPHMSPESRRILAIIRTAAQRGASIVQQVLSFARGAAGDHADVQIRHLTREIENIVRETFPRSIDVRSSVPRDLWPVQGDPTQLHQVLMNLCVNARDAMPGGGTLSISAENVDVDENYARMNIEAKPGRYVMLKVEDSGSGMPPEVVDKIFEPFFTTKEPGKGTGLGLSTTRTIVKSHGGFVNVYSEPGKGSSFKVYVPAAPSEAASAAARDEEAIPMGEGELVLVVDDEVAVREITQQILETTGYRVTVARNGNEAIARWQERRGEIKAIITDVMMPSMDGTELVRAVRAVDSDVRIIAMSGLLGEKDGPAVSGIDRFLVKPFTTETLLQTLRAALTSRTG